MAGNTVRMTRGAIEALEPPAAGADYYAAEDGPPGLWLRVNAGGRRTFLYQRKLRGRKVRVTLGAWPAVTPEEARREVLKLNGDAARGEDPTAARAKRDGCTFGALFALYADQYAAEKKRDKGAEDRRKVACYLAGLARQRMEDVTLAYLRTLQASLKRDHGPILANRTVALIRGVWNWGVRTEQPGVPADNKAAKLTPYPETARERFLSADELGRLFKALDKEGEPWREFFLLALLTGARRGNLRAMRWQDLDLAGGLWTVPGEFSKNGSPLQIVLCPEAVAVLRARQAEAEAAPVRSLYVFPPVQPGTKRGTKPAGHLTETRRAWARVCQAAELTGVRLHDLRRTMASWQAAGGASLQVIGKSLGHKSLAATQIYARLDLDPVRSSVERAAAAMLAAGRREAGA